jgi:biotin transport system substrate-specific component
MTTPEVNMPPLRASAATLAEAWIPHVRGRSARIGRDIALIVGGAALTAVGAQIAFTIPGYPVPWTFQTFGVLLTGAALGSTRGFASMVVYLAAGALGMGVFAGGTSGLEAESGGLTATIGYLIGFAVAAALVGRLAERQWDRTRTGAGLQMLLGTFVIYLIGVPFLAVLFPMSLSDAIFYGAVVFVPWDIFKVILAAFGLPFAWRLAGDRTGE